MNITTAIETRKSRRAYCGTPIEKDKISLFQSRIDEYNQKSGLSIRFLENGEAAFSGIRKSYGMFSGVRSLFIMKGPAADPNLKEKVGYYGELLILEATALGLGTCWVGGTFDASGIRTNPGEELICVITVGNVPAAESLKERLIYKAVHRTTKLIEQMLETDIEPPLWLKQGMKAVQKAPSTRNRQRVSFQYQKGLLRASVPAAARFDFVDLGIAKLHFALAAGGSFEMGNNGRYFPDK